MDQRIRKVVKAIRKNKWSLAIGSPILLGVVAFTMGMPSPLLGCGNTLHAESVSPDRQLKAVTFERSCGATTGVSTQVSIMKASGHLGNEAGNVLVLAGHPNQVAPRIEWDGNHKLLIRRPLRGAEFKAERFWGRLHRVEIDYGAMSLD